MTETKKPVKKKNDRIINLVLIGVMVLGVLIVAYPTISDWWNSYHQSIVIADYTEKVAAIDTADVERMLKEAEEYNTTLIDKEGRFAPSEEDLAYYNSILDAFKKETEADIKVRSAEEILDSSKEYRKQQEISAADQIEIDL